MKNLHVNCEHPAIILNPNLKDIILLHGNYYLNDRRVDVGIANSSMYIDFPYKKFGAIKRTLTEDDLPHYYVIDGMGERLPLFLSVACGKCTICTERKKNEWKTRAVCESQTSQSQPIFFTLTYNDFCMPCNGVRKGAIQRFMKRLRINVERYCGFKTNIRYYVCAEYGTKTKRPHYHGILWNLPLLLPEHVDDLIDKSWSFATNKKFYDSVPNKFDKYRKPVYKFYHTADKTYRVKYGYTLSSVCTQGRVKYAMKYMHKDAVIPNGCNDIFYLASRRGGIGRQWIDSKVAEFRKYPSLLSVKLKDIWSGDDYEGTLPRYFKDIICPPISRLIKKDIRDKFKLWNYYSNKFNTLVNYDYTPNPKVIAKYPTLPYHRCKVYDGELKRLIKQIQLDERLQCHKLNVRDYIDKITTELHKIIDYLEWSLLQYDYDVGLAVSSLIYKKEHIRYIDMYIEANPSSAVSDIAYNIRYNRRLASYREIF